MGARKIANVSYFKGRGGTGVGEQSCARRLIAEGAATRSSVPWERARKGITLMADLGTAGCTGAMTGAVLSPTAFRQYHWIPFAAVRPAKPAVAGLPALAAA